MRLSRSPGKAAKPGWRFSENSRKPRGANIGEESIPGGRPTLEIWAKLVLLPSENHPLKIKSLLLLLHGCLSSLGRAQKPKKPLANAAKSPTGKQPAKKSKTPPRGRIVNNSRIA